MNLYLTWMFFLLIQSSVSSNECPRNSKFQCKCYFGDFPEDNFQILCPINKHDNILVEIDKIDGEILIECPAEMENFSYETLPNNSIQNAQHLKVYLCPWPQESFTRLLEKLSIQDLPVFEFFISNSTNVSLEANHFRNFQNLKELKLNRVGITTISEETFQNLPNLERLELKDNNLVLKVGLFKFLSKLKSLDLSGNCLKNLPIGVFQALKSLQILDLHNNQLRKLESDAFQELVNLQTLELTGNGLEEISQNTFNKLLHLQEINFSSNNLKTLPDNFLHENKNLQTIRIRYNFNIQLVDFLFANFANLQHVDLTDCDLEQLPENLFENSTNLKIIQLQKNRLKTIPLKLFQGLENLEELRLEYNQIRDVSRVFQRLGKLKYLYLQKNLLSHLEAENFADLFQLKKLNLNHNQIQEIATNIFSQKPNLHSINLAHNRLENLIELDGLEQCTEIDLSFNFIQILKLERIPTSRHLILKLTNNNITLVDFRNFNNNTNATIFLKHNPFNCNYQIFDLILFLNSFHNQLKLKIPSKHLTCASPSNLKETPISSLPTNLTFDLKANSSHCPKKCVCSWRPLDQTVLINCSKQNLQYYPHFNISSFNFFQFKQIELNLENNNLRNGPRNDLNYKNVTRLFLGFNHIQELDWLPPKLEVLDLQYNNLVQLSVESKEILYQSENLSRLILNNNSWVCDCSFQDLADFLRRKPNLQFGIMFCTNKNTNLLSLTKLELCGDFNLLFALRTLTVCLLFVLLIMILYYCNREQIKIWLFSKHLCLWWITEEDLDKRKIYDAFISFSHQDERFVLQELLPVLESPPNPYKLCIHLRDWIPGELITTQITQSVLNSRRTLIIISNDFLESVWCRMEFRTAYSQAITDGRTRVIIILFGDLQVQDLDEELRVYMKTNTYIKWNDSYFWEKLTYALPHTKIKKHRKISEEANLIESESTPPLDSLKQ